MKIGILTFHRSDSYGACLQAYATVKALRNMGYDAELIDYVNPYEQQRFKPLGKGVKALMRDIKRRAAGLVYGTDRFIESAFRERESLYEGHISEKKYEDYGDLENAEYDILISGSDQIWNGNITGGLDPAYMLLYGKAGRRIAYASSMGSRSFTEDEADTAKKALSQYDHIGVRENFAKKEAGKLTNKRIDIVCDPTILLDKDEWDRKAEEAAPLEKPYGIAFFVSGYPASNMAKVREAKKAEAAPLINIQKNNKRNRKGFDKTVAGVGIRDFIRYIKDAEYVITDSFHGVVLSLIFEKRFLPLPNEKNPVRAKELLASLGLEERIGRPDMLNVKPDYEAVREGLALKREEGRAWLKKAIED